MKIFTKSNFLKGLTFLMMVLSLQNIKAQTENWIWAKGFGGAESDIGKAIAVDKRCNTYVVGYYKSGTIKYATDTLWNYGSTSNTNLFLAKHDSIGNVAWSVFAGKSGKNDEAYDVAVDNQGNIFMVGAFAGDTLKFNGNYLKNKGSYDGFLAKFNSAGENLWMKSAAGIKEDKIKAVAVDAAGNIYIAGEFMSDSLVFDNYTVKRTGSWTSSNSDIFVVKYHSSGMVLWAKQFGNTSGEYIERMVVDASNGLYIGGYFYSSKLIVGLDTLKNTGAMGDLYLFKLNTSNGNPLWARGAQGGVKSDYVFSVALDKTENNLYVTGSSRSPLLVFDAGDTIKNTSVNFNANFYIAKYNKNGIFQWVKSTQCKDIDDQGYALAVDTSNAIYVSGQFASSTLDFGSGKVISNPGGISIFFAKYNDSGVPLSAKAIGKTQSETIYDLSSDKYGNIYGVGFLTKTIALGNININISGGALNDILIAKYGTIPAPPDNGIADEYSNDEIFSIYPNPSNGNITISVEQKDLNLSSIQLFDGVGRMVYNENITSEYLLNKQITIKHAGVYFVRLILSDGKTYSKKLIVK